MKKIFIISITLCLLIIVVGCAAVPRENDFKRYDKAKKAVIKPDKALIYFFRESSNLPLYFYLYAGNGTRIGGTSPECYFFYYSNPGLNTFYIEDEISKRYFSVTTEKGKAHYIEIQFPLEGGVRFTPIEESAALPRIYKINYCEIIEE
jgi:hypothetical protein